jgi:nitroreductase
MTDATTDPRERLRPLLRTRQLRSFTEEPVDGAQLEAVADVGRWSGSSRNEQPWRFIVIRDAGTIRRIAEAGLPQTGALRSATAAIAIVLPADAGRLVPDAYDDGRAAERMLIAAQMLGLGSGITWIRGDVIEAVRPILHLPADLMVRTILAIGHPTHEALRPKSAPGTARLPREEVVFEERWPAGQP